MKTFAQGWRARCLTWRRFLAHLAVLGAAAGLVVSLPRCSRPYALLLSVRATRLAENFDLQVRDLDTQEVLLERVGEKVDPANPNRDISKQPLKVSIEFSKSGRYLVAMLAPTRKQAGERQFYVRAFDVDSVVETEALLVPVTNDGDGDGFPACGSPGIDCANMSCEFLDCDDHDASVNPLAREVCGNGKDDDCSAGCGADPTKGDGACVDADDDGAVVGVDCDDNDPCRSPKIMEARNFCKYAGPGDFSKWSPDDARWTLPKPCLDKLEREGKPRPTPPYCGDGIDEGCNGQDVPCEIDDDCDTFPPGDPPKGDCNDHDASIHPGVREICGDGIDNNCDGNPDEGCIPCDVDGDNHGAKNSTEKTCPNLVRDDPDDYDAGVHPGTTESTGGAEGGNVAGALREYCSSDLKKDKDRRRQRDIDHDGDGRAAREDGCPTENCDLDGDGFPGAQCNPSASILDCDDHDPHIFPGAPDKCGDSIRQNCAADSTCDCDQDKDGYCPPADCDDTNPAIHPWATELCDGLDNDCDGLVDEGNPDPSGVLMSTVNHICNDDNEGYCADPGCTPNTTDCSTDGRRLSGTCACSRQEPKTTRDDVHRVQCPGETTHGAGTGAASWCFGAIQADQERCEPGDFNCDGHDVRPGEDFAGKNVQSCGGNVGPCAAGKVVDCDLSRSVPYFDLVRALDGKFNEHWVCDGRLPTPETCNGVDDDCSGVVDSPDLCGGLLSGLNCAEGKCQCVQGGFCLGCCAGSGACVLVPTTGQCGLGGVACLDCADSNECTKDSCNLLFGSCSNDSSANEGISCSTGTGKCHKGSCCNGCWSGAICESGNSVGACGRTGGDCVACSSTECRDATCNGGGCGQQDKPGTPSCQGGAGTCHAGACCTGCWDGSQCVGGTAGDKCGSGGGLCSSCSATGRVCSNHVCVCGGCTSGSTCYAGTANTTCGSGGGACSDCTPGGTCFNHSCCTGCVTGGACVAGTAAGACGAGGGACTVCSAGACKVAKCTLGSCGTDNAPDVTTTCATGRCCKGTCCAGCCDTASGCQGGTAGDACGTGGVSCVDCPTATPTCQAGGCVCTGCISGVTCLPGNTVDDCGTGGGGCSTCTAGECKVPKCTLGVCGTNNATDVTTTCSTGRCCKGSCCAGCCDSTLGCQGGTTIGACGIGGAACDICNGSEQCCPTTRVCKVNCP